MHHYDAPPPPDADDVWVRHLMSKLRAYLDTRDAGPTPSSLGIVGSRREDDAGARTTRRRSTHES